MIVSEINNNKIYKIQSIVTPSGIESSFIKVVPENNIKKIFLDLLVGQNNLITLRTNEIIFIINYNPPFLEFIYNNKFIKTSSFTCSIDFIYFEKLS